MWNVPLMLCLLSVRLSIEWSVYVVFAECYRKLFRKKGVSYQWNILQITKDLEANMRKQSKKAAARNSTAKGKASSD